MAEGNCVAARRSGHRIHGGAGAEHLWRRARPLEDLPRLARWIETCVRSPDRRPTKDCAAWSPDGTRIAFVSNREGLAGIFAFASARFADVVPGREVAHLRL